VSSPLEVRSLRVAHFVQRYPPALGGSEAYFARLSEALAATGDQVTVFTSAALDLEAFWSRRGQCLPAGPARQNGVEVRRYPLWRWPGRRWLLKALSLVPVRRWQCLTLPCNPVAWRMWRDAGRPAGHFDLVHATALPYAWPMVCGLRLARRLGVPFLLTPFLHLGDPDDPHDPTRRAYTRAPLRWLLKQADRVFVQTQLEQQLVIDQGVPAHQTVLQGMGVAAGECTGGDREAARRLWDVGGQAVIGHLANNSEEKGTVDLLRAADRLWQHGKHFAVVLAGPEMPNFRSFWQSFGRKENVRRLGVLDEKGKRGFFAGLDVFALPSRSDSFGLVLLEAWANGLPNVAYRAGGIAEVVRHGEDGLLARCGDVDGLAELLGRLLDDGDLRRRLGGTGQERAGHEFRWEDKLEVVRKVYREVMK
jgi:glycosyltransferase involved in cell wall biosynthesis